MPSASQLYASGRWLNASDIVDKVGMNKRIDAVITHCEAELIGQGSDQKTMLMLELSSKTGQPWPKKLPLNKGNTMMLVASFGDDYSLWIGKSIQVWAESVMFTGKLVPGIKVQPASNGSAAQVPPAAALQSPSATAVTGAAPVAGPTWTASPKPGQSAIEDDEIPF